MQERNTVGEKGATIYTCRRQKKKRMIKIYEKVRKSDYEAYEKQDRRENASEK